jgi:NAD(P)-dependent dehydrogenase (short-subunit alcohol dehydrogenase family)
VVPVDEQRVLAGEQPTGRLVAADNVAALIAFLCGPDSADITGAVLPIDGGVGRKSAKCKVQSI